MVNPLTRRGFLLGSAAVIAGAAGALANAPARSLRPVGRAALRSPPSIQALIERAGFDGTLCFAVANARTGALLEARNPGQTLPPASVSKALTAAFALDQLGGNHRFVTRLIATGPIQNGVLQGDLILAGGADPVFDTDDLGRMADALAARGVRRVAGAFHVWGGPLPVLEQIDPGQPDHVGYNPAISGLVLNFNRVHFEWKRAGGGYAISMQARGVSHRADVTTARMEVANRSTPVYAYAREAGVDSWTVASGALGVEGARWLPVRDPLAYAGDAFANLARQAGVALPAPSVTDRLPSGTEVARHQSPPLRDILQGMLRWSTNLTAEVVGMAAARAYLGSTPRSLRASAAAMNTWAKAEFGLSDIALIDHSGLGDQSRISAADMVRALAVLGQEGALKPILRDLTLRDMAGELMPDHPVTVAAKTGTLNFVSGLAGYVDVPGGDALIFAIFSADLDRRASLTRAQRDRPPGARSWSGSARRLQSALILRWAEMV